MKQVLDLQDIYYGYPGGALILKKLNLRLYDNDRIGLLAPNGSGKTTLFHLIMGLVKPVSGKIEIFGKLREREKDFFEVRKKIGLLFQDSDDQLFCPTVLEDVAFGPLNLKKTKKEALDIARSTLKFLGIEFLEKKLTYKLSGGEKRIVSLATILSMEPEVLLLDEPSSGLDAETKDRLIRILNTLEITCIIVSHEFDFLSKTTKRVVTMKNGCILVDPGLHLHVHKHAHYMGEHPHRHN